MSHVSVSHGMARHVLWICKGFKIPVRFVRTLVSRPQPRNTWTLNMPAARKHISDLASFRYTPVKVVRSAKGSISPQVRDVEPQSMKDPSPLESESNRDPVPSTKTDYSECE